MTGKINHHNKSSFNVFCVLVDNPIRPNPTQLDCVEFHFGWVKLNQTQTNSLLYGLGDGFSTTDPRVNLIPLLYLCYG